MKKIVVLPGSFNPPTMAHLYLGNKIIKTFDDVEKVIYSPVNDGYRKKGLISGTHRLKMTELLVKDEENLIVSDTEVKNATYMNTYDSLKAIQDKYPDYEVYLLMGSDKLGQLRKWGNIKQLLTDFKILIFSRDNATKMVLLDEHPTFKDMRNRFEIINSIKEINVSSTMIRDCIKNKDSIDGLTKPNIINYIRENDLYKFDKK